MSDIYQKYMPTTLQEAYTAHVKDPELMSLKQEMGLLRTLLGKYVDGIEEGGELKVDADHLKTVRDTVDKISKTQQAISAHENRMRAVIPVEVLPIILKSIGQIIRAVVDDPKAVALIQQRIRALPNIPVKMLDVEVKDAG